MLGLNRVNRCVLLISQGSTSTTPDPSPEQIQRTIVHLIDTGSWSNDPDALNYVGNRTGHLYALLARLVTVRVIQNHSMEDFLQLCNYEEMLLFAKTRRGRRRYHGPSAIIAFFWGFNRKARYTNITYDRSRVFCYVGVTDVYNEWDDGRIGKIIVVLDLNENALITRAEINYSNDKVGPEAWEPNGIVYEVNQEV